MFISGITAAGAPRTLSSAPSNSIDIDVIQLHDIVIDELYADKNALPNYDFATNDGWGFNTLLSAKYQGDTYAGNVAYSLSITEGIKLKRRFDGEMSWKTIYEQPVRSVDDFKLEYFDYYCPANVDVEYAYVAVFRDPESLLLTDDDNPSTGSVHSKFNDYFIVDADGHYPIVLDAKNELTYNRESGTVVCFGKKYPYIINNGIAQYYSGTLNVTFVQINNCDFDFENGWKYRRDVDQFLANGRPKILKSEQGEIWMVNIVGSLPQSVDGHYQRVTHTIEWAEAGDPYSVGDLYDFGFINTDVDR